MPPRELPGFYWDESRNRYFPLSSSTKPLPITNASTSRSSAVNQYYQSPEPYKSFTSLASSMSHCQISRLHHQILCSRLASTTTRVIHKRTFPNTLCAFSTIFLDGQRTYTMAGDNKGWLYSLTDIPHQPSGPEFSLPTAISTISSSGSLCVATTFGSPCKIVVYNAVTAETFILSPGIKFVYDVWTSHFRDRSLALGMHNRGIYLRDINVSQSFQVLNTYSDVLAIHQQPNLVYTGTRSGMLSRWDTRTGTSNDKPLLSNRYSKTSIIYAEVIDDWRVLVSTVNGELDMFDLRSPFAATPVLSFPGHVNSYSQKLAFAIDPAQEFLFAAGQDNQIRSWSLRTGSLLTPRTTPEASKLFENKFEETVSAMQVVQDQENLAILVSSGPSLYKYGLFNQL